MLLLQHSQLAVGHLQPVSADSHRAQGSKKCLQQQKLRRVQWVARLELIACRLAALHGNSAVCGL